MEFIVQNRRPWDLETPVEVFTEFLTPNERFFVRSHHPEPKLKESEWKLTVEAPEREPVTIDLTALKKFEPATVTAVLQCAGNSRALYQPKVPGVQWGKGAVGNARWRGARLKDVLAQAGVTPQSPEHVVVQGADKPLMASVPAFIREVPLSKCLHPDTLLAYEMNGEPLPRLHGGPVRLVVPGWVGDDWIKWITSIKVQSEPCQAFFFDKGYRFPTEFGQPGAPVPADKMKPMTELVTRSLFARPLDQDRLQVSSPVEVKGVAWTGGDKTIKEVEVSFDGGVSWAIAELQGDELPYAWRPWSYQWTPEVAGPAMLRCRARDSSDFQQPLEKSAWNPGGYLWNSADQIQVEVSA